MLETVDHPTVNIEVLNPLDVSPGDLKPSDMLRMREDLSIEKFGRPNYPILKYAPDEEILYASASSFDWQSVQFRGAYLDEFEPLS